jgi:ABC-type transport system involved in multi-copper enzyme maturation permease subunit
MVGPLFYHEMLLGSRRSRDIIFRWVYFGWLLLQIGWIAFFHWWATVLPGGVFDQPYTAYVCHDFVEVFIPQHFILLALVTPAFVASAVTEEKTRGTLQYLLTTDLAPIHIITGKLLARVAQVCVLAAAGLPLLALLGAIGGVEPALLVGLVVMTVYVACGVASATFLTAAWTRQTRDAVLALYAIGIVIATIVLWVGGPLDWFNPVALLTPVLESGGIDSVRLLGRQLLLGLFAWGGLTLTCLGLAAWRLRPAYIKQLQGEGRPVRRWLGGARVPVGEQPVRWKEQHVEGLSPVPWLRWVPRWLGVTIIAGATIVGSCTILYRNRMPGVGLDELRAMILHLQFGQLLGAFDGNGASPAFLALATLALNVLGLLVAIRCSGAVTGERERQTWEALLLTPLSVEDLIRGKLWGIQRVSYIYLAAYAIPALFFAVFGGVFALLGVLLSLGETFLAMYYLGAVGLWASVRTRTSWRSLLITVLVAYLAAIAIYVCLLPVVFIISGMVYAAIAILAAVYGLNPGAFLGSFPAFSFAFLIAACIGLVILFLVAARWFVRSAQQWVADRERTRHWENDPTVRRRKRRRMVRQFSGDD